MVDSIKITALQDIGANIAYTTLVPLVNMAGTPTTQKANLQNLGNLILNGAGGSYFARAAQSNLALSVANAAQPNITSVGTLTSLNVTGNITAGNVNGGNIVVANFFYGDGGFLTNVAANGSYSNSNVANYLPTYTGNVSAGNVNVTGTVYANGLSSTGLASLTTVNVSTTANLGAVGNITITGGTNGQVLTTNGSGGLSWTTGSGSYSNNDVANYLPTFTGNLSAGNLVGLANANLTVYSNAGGHSFTFADDGTFYSPDNVVVGGSRFSVGPGANTLSELEGAVLVVSSNSIAFIQGVIENVSDNGSADWVAQGHYGDDNGGYVNLGFNSSGHNDANHTISGPGDGYVIVDGYANGQAPLPTGGNLVLATSSQGLTKDIVFATGGFLANNEFARFDHANNVFHLTRANSGIRFADGTTQTTAATGGGTGGIVFEYNIANFTANALPAAGTMQFTNRDGDVVAPVNGTRLWINATDNTGIPNGSTWLAMAQNSERGTITLQQGNDQQAIRVNNIGVYNDPEVYRGYRAGVNQIWGDDPSINQIIITNAAAPIFYNEDFDLEDDVFHATGLADATAVYMVNVYGSNDHTPLTQNELWSFFVNFVDNVIYQNTNTETFNVTEIRTAFYTNFSNFYNSISSSAYYRNFRFANGTTYYNSAVVTGGTGSAATLRVRLNVDYTYTIMGINDAGAGYTQGDSITVTGNQLNGTTPANDLVLTVNSVDGGGGITAVVINSGVSAYPWRTDSISDGGDDQYDTGNRINTNLAQRIIYAGGNVTPGTSAFGAGSEYAVMYNSSVFCMAATGVAITDLYYSGELGADGDGFIRWSGLRNTTNSGANVRYAYMECELGTSNLTPTVGILYQMGLDSGGINLDQFYSYYNDADNHWYFGANQDWRLESTQELDIQSYQTLTLRTLIPNEAANANSPSINITTDIGSDGNVEFNKQAGSGGSITIQAGDAGSDDGVPTLGANGGSVTIQAGDANGNNQYGGSVTIESGNGDLGYGGNLILRARNGDTSNGQIQLTTNYGDTDKTWAFTSDGKLTFPGTPRIDTDANNFEVQAAEAISLEANTVVNIYTDSGNTAYQWQFGDDGNLTLPANTFAVNYANGTQVSIGGGSGNTGNVTFDDNIVIGTGDEFGFSGLYLAVGPDSIANGTVQYLRVRGGDAPTHIHLDTGNNQAYDQYFGDDAKYVKLELGNAGNVVIGTDDANGNLYSWSFTSDGNLILADGNSVIQSIANSSLDPVLPNVSTMVFTPDSGYSSQSLVLDPTAPGHIHLRSPGANIDEPYSNIFLGGETSSFEVGYYNGAAPNLFIHSNNYTWAFDNDGNLTLPGNTFAVNYADGSPVVIGGGANTGNITFADTTISAPNNEDIDIQALNDDGVISSGITMRPGDTYTRLEQWGPQDSQTYTTADWATGVYTNQGGQGAIEFSGAAGIVNFINSLQGYGQEFYSVNGGPLLPSQGWGGGGAGITFYVAELPDPNPTTVTTFEYYYSFYSQIEMDYDGEDFNIEANNIDLNLSTTNNTDIDIYSSRNLSMAGNGSLYITNLSNVNGINIRTDGNNTSPEWSFGADGNLTLPTGGEIIVSGGLVSSGASPAPTINGFSITNSVDISGNGNIAGNNISATGAVTANTANITTGNITTINSGLLQNGNSNITLTANGNVSIQSAGSNVELVVTSTGVNVAGTLTSTGKIGYASGSTVTQTTNRGNGVIINALAGTIITVSASMTAGEISVFSVTNSQVDTNNDIVLVQVVSPNLGNYNVIANPNLGIGGFYLTLQNISGFSISAEAVTIRFMVIKAPNA